MALGRDKNGERLMAPEWQEREEAARKFEKYAAMIRSGHICGLRATFQVGKPVKREIVAALGKNLPDDT